MTTFRRFLSALCLLAVAAPASAQARGGLERPLDVRLSDNVTAPVSAVSARARVALRRSLGAEGLLRIDRLTGTPRIIGDLDGFLTGPQAGAPTQIVKRWARANRDVLGLTGRDLSAARLKLLRNDTLPGGATHLVWAQTYRGIPLLDNTLRAAVTRDGRLVSVGGSPLRIVKAPAQPLLSAAEALQKTLNATQTALAVPRLLESLTTARRTTRFAGGHHAKLIYVNMGDELRLGWQVWLDAAPDKVWDVIVDARDGRVLRRVNRVLHAGTVKAWDNYPGAPAGGQQTDHDMSAYLTATDRLLGNFTHVFLDVPDDDTPQPGDEVRPDGSGNWTYPYTPVLSPLGNCPSAGCSWNHLVPNSWQENLEQNAQQVFYFINTFADFLKQAPVGFDEASGNFQTANPAGEGKDKDPVLANTTDGAASALVLPNPLTNAVNANMLTPADGESPRMQMYLFEPIPLLAPDFADINGGDDASIIYHEFTHGLSNRLVIGGDGNGALISAQAGAMGEAWSDFYAMDFLVRKGFETDTPTPGEIIVGRFTDNGNNSIRTEAIDCPVGAPEAQCPRFLAEPVPNTGGYTYEAFGKIYGSPQVHADGEIWGQTLWDLRQALVDKYGVDAGGRRILTLVTNGMRLSPLEPSFLDMRNAILQADTMDGRSNHDLIWKVFAARGMGYNAQATDGFDETPVAGFGLPPAPDTPTGTVSGTVTNADGGAPLAGVPAGITAFFSGLDSDYSAFSGVDGTWRITGVPAGSYGAVRVGGLGFEAATLGKVDIEAGQNKGGFDAQLRRNWGMLEGGAKLVERTGKDTGCGPRLALDADPGSGWETFSHNNPVDPGAKHFTIKLPAPIDVSRLVIDPTNNCFSDPTSSLAGYKVEFSADGTNFGTVSEGEFTPADRHPNDIPVPANLAGGVQFVRMTMKSSMGLLADPTGMTGMEFMDLTEMSVYGTSRDKAAPRIRLDVVSGGAVKGPNATIRGRVTDNYAIARVTVNGGTATVDNDGSFSMTLPVDKGENKIDVEAFDGSQNRATKSVTVLGDFTKPRFVKVSARRSAPGRVRVRGRVRDDTGIRVVRVVGKRAKRVGGKFERQVKSKAKRVKVAVVDLAGRKTVRRVQVRR